MPVHYPDILDERESLRAPFTQSVIFHVAVVGLIVVSTMNFGGKPEQWGGATHVGDAVSVNSVKTIPLPSRTARPNPVANDTESQVPQAAKPEPKKQVKAPDENAIPLKSRIAKKQLKQQAEQRYRPEPLRPNQMTASQAPAASSPVFQKPGGAVGLGTNNTLG